MSPAGAISQGGQAQPCRNLAAVAIGKRHGDVRDGCGQ